MHLNTLIFLICAVLFLNSCAKIGTPTGGPVDNSSPIIEESVPKNKSTNFIDNKIKITFDEFIKIKNLRNNLLISPPLELKPTILIKGKNLVISDLADLKSQTTYTILLGDAIIDLNEGNTYENFEFVFSTGNTIDSANIEGKVMDAFNHKGMENMLLLAYKDVQDSTIVHDVADYIAKTDESGEFRIVNVPIGSYHLFAINDANSNGVWDSGAETIAFLDSTIIAKVSEEADSIVSVDSVPDEITILHAFNEDVMPQYITDYDRELKFSLRVIFSKEQDREVKLEILDVPEHEFLIEENPSKDTLIYWIKDSLIYNLDTLALKVEYEKRDSLDDFVKMSDTLIYKVKRKKKQQSKKKELEEVNVFTIKTMVNHANLDLAGGIPIDVNLLVSSIVKDSISLIRVVDSVEVDVPFELTKLKESNSQFEYLRRYALMLDIESGIKYKLSILPGAFNDYWGNTNDTLEINVNARMEDYYGNIELSIENGSSDGIVQILDDKDMVLREYFIGNENIINLTSLHPRVYQFKYIEDRNNNRKWDTGDYFKKIQPESIYFYPEKVNVKSQWDNKIEWNLE